MIWGGEITQYDNLKSVQKASNDYIYYIILYYIIYIIYIQNRFFFHGVEYNLTRLLDVTSVVVGVVKNSIQVFLGQITSDWADSRIWYSSNKT